MNVIKINPNNKKEVQRFVGFPFDLYKDSDLWVPPLVGDMYKNFNRDSHPFYEHSEVDFFLIEENGKVLGRIAALENSRYNNHHEAKMAFFGYFDCIENVKVSRMLFKTVDDWAKERGMTEIIGPRGLLPTEGTSVLVDGFEYLPAMGIPYNFPYYDELIKDGGFSKDTDHLSGHISERYEYPERLNNIATKMMKRRGFWIKSFTSKAEMREWLPKVTNVHRMSFEHGHRYIPTTPREAEMAGETFIAVTDPGMVKLVMKEDDVAGFLISYIDISRGIQKAKGKLFPIGWIHILIDKKRSKRVNINGVGLLPKYQGLGANAILYTELGKTLLATDVDFVDIVMVDEKNFRSFSDMESLGVKWYKRHRCYHKTLHES